MRLVCDEHILNYRFENYDDMYEFWKKYNGAAPISIETAEIDIDVVEMEPDRAKFCVRNYEEGTDVEYWAPKEELDKIGVEGFLGVVREFIEYEPMKDDSLNTDLSRLIITCESAETGDVDEVELDFDEYDETPEIEPPEEDEHESTN